MELLKHTDIVTPELLEGGLDHDAHDGFLEDYRTLTALLRIHKPKTIFEIGTNVGSGVNVMHAALPDAKIYSLDLDYETMRQNSKQYPLEDDGADRVGSAATCEYTQLRGDSMTFDYSKYPCEAYYVDGEHTEKNAYHETMQVLAQAPKIIIYHDADMEGVWAGIVKAHETTDKYWLYRVEDTRIAYLLRK